MSFMYHIIKYNKKKWANGHLKKVNASFGLSMVNCKTFFHIQHTKIAIA